MIYNLPLSLLSRYPQGDWVVRSQEAASLPLGLAEQDPEHVIAVQLLSLTTESDVLNAWAPGLLIELVMTDPDSDYPLLYHHTNLLDNHPVRVIIPVQPGFSKAVKVAVSLDFAVRLDLAQPDPALVAELATTLDFYLHQPTVAQPIEFFHSLLVGFYRGEPLPLWTVLDEEPPYLRYVADDGSESYYGRLAACDLSIASNPALQYVDDYIEQVLATTPNCRHCEFLNSCGGYLQWPRRDYDCTAMKQLFDQIKSAALELQRDLTAAAA